LRITHLCGERKFIYGGPVTTDEGLRERKKRATRAALSWAAIRLSVERGYANVLVDDIAEAAGVSPRTFNNYFAGKAEAIVARHIDRCARLAEDLRSRPAGEPLWEAVRQAAILRFVPGPEVVEQPAPDLDEWADGLRVLLAEPAVHGELLRSGAVNREALAAAVAERTGLDARHDVYPHLIAAAVIGASEVAMRHWLYSDPSLSMEQILLDTIDQLAAGLPTP
jgi:AcrR family transcriptional regulator